MFASTRRRPASSITSRNKNVRVSFFLLAIATWIALSSLIDPQARSSQIAVRKLAVDHRFPTKVEGLHEYPDKVAPLINSDPILSESDEGITSYARSFPESVKPVHEAKPSLRYRSSLDDMMKLREEVEELENELFESNQTYEDISLNDGRNLGVAKEGLHSSQMFHSLEPDEANSGESPMVEKLVPVSIHRPHSSLDEPEIITSQSVGQNHNAVAPSPSVDTHDALAVQKSFGEDQEVNESLSGEILIPQDRSSIERQTTGESQPSNETDSEKDKEESKTSEIRENIRRIEGPNIPERSREDIERDLSEIKRGFLLHDPATRVQKNFHDDLKGLRVAAFGTSRTWGATLADPTTNAYVKLLSPNGHNLAIRATAADYPSLCAYSMIGDDDRFDVIVLEFFANADYHLLRLAKRLRHRFPDAMIIVLKIWSPSQFRLKGSGQTMPDWAEANGISFDAPNFMELLQEKTSDNDWKFCEAKEALDMQIQAVKAVDGMILELPRPKQGNIFAVSEYRHLFAKDMKHLNEIGHRIVAEGIKSKLLELDVRPSNLVHEWDFKDYCDDWLMTGRPSRSIKYQPNEARVVEFEPHQHKFALEMKSAEVPLQLFNPFEYDIPLYLRYMKSYPAPGLYPMTRIYLEGKHTAIGVDPTGHESELPQHVNRIVFLGHVKPGWSEVLLQRAEEGKRFPFRVTGFMMSPLDEIFDLDNALVTRDTNDEWSLQSRAVLDIPPSE